MTIWTKEDQQKLVEAVSLCYELDRRRLDYALALEKVLTAHRLNARGVVAELDVTALRKALEPFDPSLAADDGWIEWNGGECPVPGDTPLRLKRRDGGSGTGIAGAMHWAHMGVGSDSIAYRVIGQ